MRLASIVGLCISIIDLTWLFLINQWNSSDLVVGFIVVSFFVMIYFVYCLFWSSNEIKVLKNNEYQPEDTSHNSPFTRLALFFGIILLILFATFYICYIAAQQSLVNSFSAAASDSKEIDKYEAYLHAKNIWIHALSIVNIICLVKCIMVANICGAASTTRRLMIYLFGICLIINCFIMFGNLADLRAITKGATGYVNWLPLEIMKIIAACAFVVVFILVLANYKRLRIAYLILGTFFLLCLSLAVPNTGKAFREYRSME